MVIWLMMMMMGTHIMVLMMCELVYIQASRIVVFYNKKDKLRGQQCLYNVFFTH